MSGSRAGTRSPVGGSSTTTSSHATRAKEAEQVAISETAVDEALPELQQIENEDLRERVRAVWCKLAAASAFDDLAAVPVSPRLAVLAHHPQPLGGGDGGRGRGDPDPFPRHRDRP